ncbi:MMPL family transporter [Sphaerochaeta sp. PS]|uniref:efflux RND transporter permease subunit n=1 Tax=Sphaerochaeta sp. PS TaxID=3076336 RepID=UPI0028A4065E|nr:MMPL family transporter [Sphaerochaeta sp. PS]MDT4761016.1 MMPL family transporter [Sphaerochaeta sp. PS]
MIGRRTKDLLLIAAVLALSVVSLLQIGKLHIDSSTNAFIPQNAPVVQINNEIEAQFGSLDLIVVNLYNGEGSMLGTSSLGVLDKVTQAIEALPLSFSVTSLTNTDHLGSSDEGLLVEKLYDAKEEHALENLTLRLGEWGDLYEGNLISRDRSMASIIVEAVVGADMDLLLKQIKAEVARIDLQGLTVSLIGLPVVTNAIEQSLLSDLAILAPIVGLLIVLLLFLSFGRFKAVILSLFCLVVTASIMLGLMALLQLTFTMATMLVPVLLLIVGSAYTIHILSHFYEEASNSEKGLSQEGRDRIIAAVVQRNRTPLIMAGATTAAGFLAQLTSPLGPFRTFGLLCAIGVVLSLVATLYIVPALLRLSYANTTVQKRHKHVRQRFDPSRLFIYLASKQSKLLILLSLLFITATLILLPRIKTGTNMLDFFRPSSALVKDTRLYNSKMQGSGILTVMIKRDGDASILEPSFLTSLDEFSSSLEQRDDVGGVQTILPFIKRMNQILGPQQGESVQREQAALAFDFFGGSFGEAGGDDAPTSNDENLAVTEGGSYYEIPSDPEKYGLTTEEELGQLITQYLLLYSGNLGKFINDPIEPNALLMTISLLKSDTKTLREVTNTIRSHFEQTLPAGWRAEIGGGEAISLALTELVTRSQIYSLFGALLIVWFLLLLLFRSVKLATLGLIPCVFALMGIFTSMAVFSIELDIVTSLLASLAIGIGVDYAIHLIAAYQRIGSTLPQGEVFTEVMKTTGKAILINAASVTLGFLGLLFSQFTPISRMGLLFCISMVFASLSSLTILPALLRHMLVKNQELTQGTHHSRRTLS